ncbi:fibronectin type III domain-containing protein [Paenibacillus puerhi]|uniref:fibronectin type III domain-containing protein n=1 Tax=Paenibacillus puerhi TaxID=2692622 RepID=UPI0019165BEA|nr:fibronectin type III domain-containing protein [Paenibacillus puerhi]
MRNWTKNTYPVLATDDLVNQQGPGHNSFTVDEFGNPVIIYHARTPGEREGSGNGGLGDPGRHARVKPVHFTADGGIVFSMTPEEELNPQYKNVSMNVVVEELAGTPTAPDNVIVTANSAGSIEISWDPVNGALGYHVYRSDSPNGEYVKLNAAGIAGTTYSDTGLNAATTYYYKVSAVNAAGGIGQVGCRSGYDERRRDRFLLLKRI